MSRRKAVLLLVFSCSVADYEETKGFWQNFFLYQNDYEGLRYILNDFKSLPTFFQWFMALSSWKIGFVFVLHTLQGKEIRYRISANSFRGNYSFLNLALFTVTFDLYFINLNSCRGNYSREETIQGRKLFAEIRYMKY